MATITSLARELNPTGLGEHIYIYIYIYIYKDSETVHSKINPGNGVAPFYTQQLKREPLDHPRLGSPTLLLILYDELFEEVGFSYGVTS